MAFNDHKLWERVRGHTILSVHSANVDEISSTAVHFSRSLDANADFSKMQEEGPDAYIGSSDIILLGS